MLIPNRFEDIQKNPLVVGAEVISLLKNEKHNVESLFQRLKEKIDITIDLYYDTLTYLWLSNIIVVLEFKIKLV